MPENLNVEVDKILKRMTHVILGVDNGADTAFKKTEQKAGVQNLP